MEHVILYLTSKSMSNGDIMNYRIRQCFLPADDSQFGPLSIKCTTGKRLASVALDAIPRQIRQPRGNVWDRLGKPCEGEGRRQNKIFLWF